MYWLPETADWTARLRAMSKSGTGDWSTLTTLANARLGFMETIQLDRAVQKLTNGKSPEGIFGQPVRLAVLGSSTMENLLPGLRVGAMRRGMWLTTYVPAYGQYLQDLLEPASNLTAFAPNTILFALDARHVIGETNVACSAADADAIVKDAVTRCREVWRLARTRFKARIIQQTLMPVFPSLAGHNEHRLPGSRAVLVERVNQRLRDAADAAGIDLLSIDRLVTRHGLDTWYDPVMWNTAKQEVRPAMSHVYGEHVARIVAAQQGRSFKCLVLDLDNTLWGGVIGDAGLTGIILGQGSSSGEAFLSLQHYARDLSRRGIILAVCSKNDEVNALLPFEQHPEMLLKRADIACFTANWADKPSNLRDIAATLNIGIDSLVFADDNPFERELVRRELPMVAVPELPEDPAGYVQCLSDAGYFESVRVTTEDLERSHQYQANAQRDALRATATDLTGYLAELRMEMDARRFDRVVDDVGGIEQRAGFARRAVHGRRAVAQGRGDVRAREARQPRGEHVEPQAGLGVVDDVPQARFSRTSCERTSSPTPMVMQASATLNTLGQIVRKSMKSTTQRCWKRSTMFPIAPPTIIPKAIRTSDDRLTASRKA